MIRNTSVLFFAVIASLAILLLSGCYYIGQGTQLLAAYGGAEEIEQALTKGNLEEDERDLLLLVRDIKRFAVDNLGLKENRNYTTYKRIDADHLATVVSACPADSFKQYLWNYPIMGKMPYKGFFDREGALAEAKRLEKEGCDVWVRDVDAFSTLGFFSDPIFSYMKSYPVFSLADMLIHEQTHATIFSKNSVDFSENLASFVGEQGALAFLAMRDGPESALYRESLDLISDQATYNALLRELRDRLEDVYQTDIPKEEKIASKSAVISAWKAEFSDAYGARFLTKRYASVPNAKIDNAYLCTMMNYVSDLSLFERLFEKEGRNLARMIAITGDLVAKPGAPFANLRVYLGDTVPALQP